LTFTALPINTVRRAQRWLVVPYRGSDSSSTFSFDRFSSILASAESYWNDMAQGSRILGGSTVLSAGFKPSDGVPVQVGLTSSQLAGQAPSVRVPGVMEAVLSITNATGTAGPALPIDLRHFTGLVFVSSEPAGDGYVGQMRLPSAILPTPECIIAERSRGGSLDFDVIELSFASYGSARLAQLIGRSLGFDFTSDPYSLMADDYTAHRYTVPTPTTFGRSDWGSIGPGIPAEALDARGWIPDHQKFVPPRPPSSHAGEVGIGSVALRPLVREVNNQTAPREGFVLAAIGPWSFEYRTHATWDRGIPNPVVRASSVFGELLLGVGQGEAKWGSDEPALTGGGRVVVSSMSADQALLSYESYSGPLIVAGGGTLRGGGTILIHPDGRITRIPPGDPLEVKASELIRDLSRIRQE
jgi:hypothetical protein